ncbi:MAG: response regulator [Polyangiaceae bacterium]|nr:response regulator [Polyangiaceae bacterium]
MGEQAAPAQETRGKPLDRGPIMVVDDDEDVRETIRDALEMNGYSVVTAENGRVALDKLATMERPGLILLDLMMPVMDGLEFLAAGLASRVLEGIPVIVITAYDHLAAKASDATAVVKKPIDLAVLMTWVERSCG